MFKYTFVLFFFLKSFVILQAIKIKISISSRKMIFFFRIHSALASRIRHTRNIRIADRSSNNKTKLSDVRIWIIWNLPRNNKAQSEIDTLNDICAIFLRWIWTFEIWNHFVKFVCFVEIVLQ